TSLVPGKGLGGGYFLGEIKTLEPGECLEFGHNRVSVELAGWLMCDDAIGHAIFADQGSEGTGVDAGDADDVPLLEPGVELFGGAIIGRVGDVGLEHNTPHARERRHIHRLDVFVVSADIADMGKGECDD